MRVVRNKDRQKCITYIELSQGDVFKIHNNGDFFMVTNQAEGGSVSLSCGQATYWQDSRKVIPVNGYFVEE